MRQTCYIITKLKTMYTHRNTAIIEVFYKDDNPIFVLYLSSGYYKIVDMERNTKIKTYHWNYIKIVEIIMCHTRSLLPKQDMKCPHFSDEKVTT